MDFQTQRVLLGAAGAGKESSWALRIYQSGSNVLVKDMLADSVGNFYVIGSSAGAATIWKFDAEGSLLWSFKDTNTNVSEYTGIAFDSSGNLIITGYDPSAPMMMSVSPSGSLNSKYLALNGSISLSGGSSYAAVSTDDKFLFRSSSSTQQVAINYGLNFTTNNWRRYVNIDTSYPRWRWYDAKSDKNGGFLILGNSDVNQYAPYIQRINSSGTSVWAYRMYSSGSYRIQGLQSAVTDGTYIYAGFPRYYDSWSRQFFGAYKINVSDGSFVADCSTFIYDGDSGSFCVNRDIDVYNNAVVISGEGKNKSTNIAEGIMVLGVPTSLGSTINFKYSILRSDNADIRYSDTRCKFLSSKSVAVCFLDRDSSPLYYIMVMKLPTDGSAAGKSADMTTCTYNITNPNWIYSSGADYGNYSSDSNYFSGSTTAGSSSKAMTPTTAGTSLTKVTL